MSDNATVMDILPEIPLDDDSFQELPSSNIDWRPKTARPRFESHNSTWSDASGFISTDDSERDIDGETVSSSQTDLRTFCGYKLPVWCPIMPSGLHLALYTVTYAPCFGCGQYPPHRTNRVILGRLNLLLAFFSLFPIGTASFLCIVLFSQSLVNRSLDYGLATHLQDSYDQAGDPLGLIVSSTYWNTIGALILFGLTCLVLLITASLTHRVVRNVNLVGAVRFYWACLWMLPFLIWCVVAMIDYFNAKQVWITKWWTSQEMAWFRWTYCDPQDTYNSLCTVPLVENATGWCLAVYNSTDCARIRDDAQATMLTSLNILTYFSAGWGLVIVFLLCVTQGTLTRIITKPLVEKSRTSNVAGWLSLPILACLAFGLFIAFANQSVLNAQLIKTGINWIGPLFIAASGESIIDVSLVSPIPLTAPPAAAFIACALLSWYVSHSSILSAHDKRKKVAAIVGFIGLSFVAMIMLLVIFGTGLAFSASFADNPIDDRTRGVIACFLDQQGVCSRCDAATNKCPEWTRQDVTVVIQTQIKITATVAAICITYSFGVIQFGLALKRHLSTYQIAYV